MEGDRWRGQRGVEAYKVEAVGGWGKGQSGNWFIRAAGGRVDGRRAEHSTCHQSGIISSISSAFCASVKYQARGGHVREREKERESSAGLGRGTGIRSCPWT